MDNVEALIAEAGQAARRLGHAAGGRRHRAYDRYAGGADGAGRHHHRRRQHRMYKDDIRRARPWPRAGIEYVDVGTSGGVWAWNAATA